MINIVNWVWLCWQRIDLRAFESQAIFSEGRLYLSVFLLTDSTDIVFSDNDSQNPLSTGIYRVSQKTWTLFENAITPSVMKETCPNFL